MENRHTRRAILGSALTAAFAGVSISAQTVTAEVEWSLPIAFPDQHPGDGLFIKHGYACEHAEYYPGLLHTGENWYGIDRNATEADVLAVAAGEVVYAAFDYPGRVVIVQHEQYLFSMYGHLDYNVAVTAGQQISRGDRLGRPLPYPGNFGRSHLHFEIRTFLIKDAINGNHPSHGFTCGFQCPPGPGYWPINAAQHPSELGWLNPTHAIARRMFPDGPHSFGAAAMTNSIPSASTTDLLSSPPWKDDSKQLDQLTLKPGDRYPLLQIAPGPEDSRGRNAEAYRLWYRIALPSGEPAWVRAAVASTTAVGLDGMPAAITFDFILDAAIHH